MYFLDNSVEEIKYQDVNKIVSDCMHDPICCLKNESDFVVKTNLIKSQITFSNRLKCSDEQYCKDMLVLWNKYYRFVYPNATLKAKQYELTGLLEDTIRKMINISITPSSPTVEASQ